MEAQDHRDSREAELKWACVCNCRQINSAALISLLRQLPGRISTANQKWFLDHCLNDPLASKFPRDREFNRKVLRAVVVAAQEDNQDLDEDLIEAFAESLLTTASSEESSLNDQGKGSSWSYKIYSYASEQLTPLQLIESLYSLEESTREAGLIAVHVNKDMLAGDTGCHAWEAGFYLSEYIFSNPEVFKSKCCVELGAGIGIAGIALKRAGAAQVLCTDGDAEAVDNCKLNLRLNGVLSNVGTTQEEQQDLGGEGDVEVQILRWEEGTKGIVLPSINVIVGSDIVYDPLCIPTLIHCLKSLLGASASGNAATTEQMDKYADAAYIASTLRNETTFKAFIDAVEADTDLQLEDITASALQTAAAADSHKSHKVRFCHIKHLEDARERIYLHKITKIEQ